MDELEFRVQQFNSLQLPGQPMSMHMGTNYLVNDLWREVQRLRLLTPTPGDSATGCPFCGVSAEDIANFNQAAAEPPSA